MEKLSMEYEFFLRYSRNAKVVPGILLN